MNKIVLEHYPASKLPDELRGSIARSASVRIVIEESERQSMTLEEFRASMAEARKRTTGVTMEEAVARIRELRDEWDD
jgi:hypothetical protein